ncbi:GATOR1 complex protein NPRL3-like [Mytilus galloprovincialis]|uniref:GATOR1 complex protein NPRL3-like n=1 Tax=Mytilus galloprovincialis TaxID=29158 RepID=UPI003F7BF100
MGILEKIGEIEREIGRTQKNKATEYHLGLLKAKLAKYRQQLLEPTGKAGAKGEGFDVMKSGDARVALIGFPSVGKSTLLNTLTTTHSESAGYEFTTLTCIPGVIEYNGANIQLLDLPGIIEGAAQGKGRGRQVIAVARTADVVIMMLDATKGEKQKELLTMELESVGIRLNRRKPNIYFKPKKGGGISFNSTLTLTKCNEKLCQMILHEWKIFNAEILFRDDCTSDEFVDVILGSRVYMPCIYVYNKIDQISIEEVDRLARKPHSVVVSCNMNLNLDYLLSTTWEYLALVRVYTKKRGERPDFDDGLILRTGCTLEHVCHKIHRTMVSTFKYGLVWGRSAKYSPQRVGIHHKMCHDDVVQIINKYRFFCKMTDFDPVSILLVTSGTRGERLLFQYPNFETARTHQDIAKSKRRNVYSVRIAEDVVTVSSPVSSNTGTLSGFSKAILANLLSVKPALCGQPFDLKVDDLRFIGFPMLLDQSTKQQTSGKISHQIGSFNIVFVLKASVDQSVINCYFDLVKQLTGAIKYEESRRQYLSTEAKIMISIHDDIASLPEDQMHFPYDLIRTKSSLARDLRTAYESVKDKGVVHLYINKWIEVTFCLPHKVHSKSSAALSVKVYPEVIQRCIEALRPYHGVLLLVDGQNLLDTLSTDCTPALNRLINVIIQQPVRSLQIIALEADLSLSQVFQLVSHLVYWGKATIVYPLCESNVYLLSPSSNIKMNSKIAEEFVQLFPGRSLAVELSEFSYPTKLWDTQDMLNKQQKQQEEKVSMVVWLLQHGLIHQLHTYVFLMPPLKSRLYVEDRTSSFSDVTSVNSDESQIHYQSPSSELASDGSFISEEIKGFMPMEDTMSKLTREEQDYMLNLSAAKNTDDLRLFLRLCPYFNGLHHFEEIMFYEDLTRSQLLTLLDKFQDVLITCQYPDQATIFNSS